MEINHIGIAVKDLDSAIKLYTDFFKAELEDVTEYPETGLKIAMLSTGNTTIELLQPLGTEGAIAKFIETKGEGIHHLCFGVDNIEKELQRFADGGIRLIDTKPRQGVEGKIAFVHPKSLFGVLAELVEPDESN